MLIWTAGHSGLEEQIVNSLRRPLGNNIRDNARQEDVIEHSNIKSLSFQETEKAEGIPNDALNEVLPMDVNVKIKEFQNSAAQFLNRLKRFVFLSDERTCATS